MERHGHGMLCVNPPLTTILGILNVSISTQLDRKIKKIGSICRA